MGDISLERSYSLVGQFMCQWALVESVVNRVIAEALKLDTTQSFIISTILSTRQKIRVLSTLVNLSPINETQKLFYKRTMQELDDKIIIRNIIAHSPFLPSKDKQSIEFLRVQLKKGEIRAPEIKWSEKEFLSYFQDLVTLSKELDLLNIIFKQAKAHQALAEALCGTQTNPLAGLSDPGQLPSAESRDSDPVDVK